MSDLASFLANEFLPLQADGGLWRHKDPEETAMHYLKAMSDHVEKLQRDVQDLHNEIRSLSHG